MRELSLLAVKLCLAQPRVLTPAACWCRYADDPTVMSWNLINEPRCYQCGDVIQVRSALSFVLGSTSGSELASCGMQQCCISGAFSAPSCNDSP